MLLPALKLVLLQLCIVAAPAAGRVGELVVLGAFLVAHVTRRYGEVSGLPAGSLHR